MAAAMTRGVLLAVALGAVAALGCHRSDATAASSASATAGHGDHRNQRRGQAAATSLEVVVDGKPAAAWTGAELAAAAAVTVTNQNGETRQVWPLQTIVHKLVGPKARIVALDADGDRVDVDAKAWNDPARTLVLHLSRRGEYKAHWVSGGVADEALIKGVRKIEISSKG
jgi:hypothetical protein